MGHQKRKKDKCAQSMSAMVEKFLTWMKVQNYSDATVKMREHYLGKFLEWCDERSIDRASEVTKPILERYKRHVFNHRKKDGKPLSINSQTVQLTPVKMFFRWLAHNNHVLYDPASGLELPRQEKHLPRHVLTVSEVEQVMGQPDMSTPRGLRDRAIMETFYSTGIRRRELSSLDVFDVDAGRGTLMIRQGKGKKDRIVPIGERALRWIDKYVADARQQWIPNLNDGPLFVTKSGEPMKIGYLSYIVKRYVDDAEISKTGSCHLLRHSMATLMLENGADIRYVQEMLGHSYLASTQIYTHVSITKLKEVHERTHPARMERVIDLG